MKAIDIKTKFGGDVYTAIECVNDLIEKKKLEKPIKPVLKNAHTSEDYRRYADDFEVYEMNIKHYNAAKVEFDQTIAVLRLELNEYIKEQSGLYDIPTKYQHKVWIKAYQDGHSDGLYSVYNHLVELVGIF
jgi:hypothetical protein